MENLKISVCIPVYEADGKGVFFLRKNIKGILNQTYKNFEIVISDHSVDYEIQDYVLSLKHPKIKYVRFGIKRGYGAFNTNNAIKNATGDLIKLMNQDDYIESSDFFKDAIHLIKSGKKWVLSSFKHLDYETGNFFRPQIPSFGVKDRARNAYSMIHALGSLRFPVICKPLKSFPRGHEKQGEFIESHMHLPLIVLNREDLLAINDNDTSNFPTSDLYDTFHEVKSIHLLDGINLIGCPSVGLIPKEELVDVNLKYMIDCELWYRLYKKYGEPGIIEKDFPIIIGMGNHQVTQKMAEVREDLIEHDKQYCSILYNNK